MMIGERTHPLNPTIQVPPWPVYDDPPTPTNYSPYPLSGVNSPRNAVGGGGEFSPYDAALTALRRFLPSNDAYNFSEDGGDADTAIDAYSCDEFRMYEFKVRRCARGRSHDWTECPYSHPGEKARRRDPRKYHYSGTACPDFRKGNCKRGDSCEFAHGVFECWLHPARYRTQPCKDGVNCRRRVCFFAHTPEQLRVLPQQQQSPKSGGNSTCLSDSYDGSPLRQQQHHHLSGLDPYLMSNAAFLSSSPTSTLMSPPSSPPSDSPPLSPSGAVTTMRRANGSSSVNEILVSLRQLQLNKATKSPIGSCGPWGIQQIVFPRGNLSYANGLNSTIPTTTTRMSVIGGGVGLLDGWDEPVERVESGRDLRFMMAEKLSKESSLNRTTASDDDDVVGSCGSAPDVDWVSDLLQ